MQKIRGIIEFANNTPLLIMVVGLPFCGSRTLFEDNKKPDHLSVNRVLNRQEEQYNGVLDIKLIREALKKNFVVTIFGSFIDVKSRMEFLKEIADINVPKQCLIDSTPYNMCIPHNKEFLEKFDAKTIDIPTYSEGFSKISVASVPIENLPEFYIPSNMRKRYFDLSTPNREVKEDNNSQTLLATKYAINNNYSALEIISVFFCCTASELLKDLTPESVYRVSGFDFYSYGRKFLTGLNDCGYNENDFYESGVAIQQIPTFLSGDLREDDLDGFIGAYGLGVYEKAKKYAEAILKTQKLSCKPEFYLKVYENIIVAIGKKIEEESSLD